MHNDFKPINRSNSLYQQVAARIKESILSGRLRPGQQLPSESDLAEQFGVSRPVMREAVKTLQSRGFLEVRRGSKGGVFVGDLTQLNLAEDLLDLLRLRRVTVEDMYQARRLLEPEVVRQAALNMDEKHLRELGRCLQEAENVCDPQAKIFCNGDFHRLIARASGNGFFTILMDCFMDVAEGMIRVLKPLGYEIHEESEHRQIYEALVRRDVGAAVQAVKDHLEHTMKSMLSLEDAWLKRQAAMVVQEGG